MTIKVLGPGCVNCKTFERRTQEVVAELHLDAEIQQVKDLDSITSYGVLRTPGLAIDGALVWQGSVPTREKIKELLQSASTGIVAP